jgi:hypothetical protein
MTTFEYTLTTGVFGTPGGAQVIDWMLLNDSDVDQAYRVTAYNCEVGVPKQAAPPGPLEGTLSPSVATHNGNEIGVNAPFRRGIPVEVVVEVNDYRMLPTVEIWSDLGATIIAGTRIGPGQFVRLS